MVADASKKKARAKSFTSIVLAGHKEHAVELPFDPGAVWNVNATSLRPGRRGWPVQVTSKRRTFASHVVARSRRFWLLLDAEVLGQLEVQAGDSLSVKLEPAAAAR